jgi:hypothetical protein
MAFLDHLGLNIVRKPHEITKNPLNGASGKVSPPLSEQTWADALCKSQKMPSLEVVLSAFNSGFRKQINK